MSVVLDQGRTFEMMMPVVVVGAGGCGLCAAIAGQDAGVEVLVLERDATPLGSTGMSTGLIPAAGTPEQEAEGIEDDGARFAADILGKAGRADAAIVRHVADESAETIAWLQGHGLPLTLVKGFVYSGHSVRRMFGSPNRTGGELIAGLQQAAEAAGASILCGASVETLFVDAARRVTGVAFRRPDGAVEEVGCSALILASCGFGGNAALVRDWIPEIGAAPYHGHPGNRGDAIAWGAALDAGFADMTAYQGHGNLAAGHGIIVNWPSVILGGFQLNRDGDRFYDESIGYSAAAAHVHAQPGHVAWTIFDARIAATLDQFEDYQDAVRAGAIVAADDVAALAAATRLPAERLAATMATVANHADGSKPDPFGRDFTAGPPLAAPYRAVRVTGALLHTQGGLVVDRDARVVGTDGAALPNLFAGGGAARGVSGPGAAGYIAGNGLLTATTLGKLAGRAAAAQVGG
ncbi:FAD-dependent oxidoreductase [uncultured Sphingomonas sp.]|uniref:FAD-dependent oxidoreductase n=1 Tax=uncultured Sphingomonas sp. TaxID=158754 RepID=UPI0035CB81DD